jgi:hypothetical protein
MRTSSTVVAEVAGVEGGGWRERIFSGSVDELDVTLHNLASLLLTNRKKRRSKLFKNLDNR